MSAKERRKGLRGEREVADVFRAEGLAVRPLEYAGDWIVFGDGLSLHVEVKRQETARVWVWQAQVTAEAPDGTVPVVAFRRSRGQWWAMLPLDELARMVPMDERP